MPYSTFTSDATPTFTSSSSLLYSGPHHLYSVPYSALLSFCFTLPRSILLFSPLHSSTLLFCSLLSLLPALTPTLLYSPPLYSTTYSTTLISSPRLCSTSTSTSTSTSSSTISSPLLTASVNYSTLFYSTLLHSTLLYSAQSHSILFQSALLGPTRFSTVLRKSPAKRNAYKCPQAQLDESVRVVILDLAVRVLSHTRASSVRRPGFRARSVSSD